MKTANQEIREQLQVAIDALYKALTVPMNEEVSGELWKLVHELEETRECIGE